MYNKKTEEVSRFNFLVENRKYINFDNYRADEISFIAENMGITFNTLMETNVLTENEEAEKERIINLIRNNQFDTNNNEAFLNALYKGDKKSFLSNYGIEDFNQMRTFKLNGYDIGYAIRGDGDIVSVFNNSGVKNVGKELVQSAINNGGTKLDHFDGFLSSLYEPLGFKETQRMKWDDQYAPKDWDYEKYGKPDVIMRSL